MNINSIGPNKLAFGTHSIEPTSNKPVDENTFNKVTKILRDTGSGKSIKNIKTFYLKRSSYFEEKAIAAAIANLEIGIKIKGYGLGTNEQDKQTASAIEQINELGRQIRAEKQSKHSSGEELDPYDTTQTH